MRTNDLALLELDPLCYALRQQDILDVKSALAAGANPNGYKQYMIARPPMHEAALRDFVEGLEALHAAGGLVDGPENFTQTPLMVAAANGRLESIRWLLRHGADLSLRNVDDEDRTALEIVLDNCDVAVASVILQERPDIRDHDLTTTAQHVIDNKNDLEVARWLLDAGVSPDLTTITGNPWLLIVQSCMPPLSMQLTQMLLEAGANIDSQNDEGKTALYRTLEFADVTGFSFLLRAGASPDIADNHGHTVRYLLTHPQFQQMEKFDDMRNILLSWEASCAAQQAMQHPSESVKPL